MGKLGGRSMVVVAGLSMLWVGACGEVPAGTQVAMEVMKDPAYGGAQLVGQSDGTIYFVTSLGGTVDIGADGTLTADPYYTGSDATGIARRLRPDGGRDWTRRVGDLGDGWVDAVATRGWDGDGSFIVARQRAIFKLNASGEPLWVARCGSWRCGPEPFISDLVATADGGAILMDGSTLMVRLAGDGSVKWTTTAVEFQPGCEMASFGRIAELPDGAVVVAGNTPLVCPTRSDTRIARFDASGNLLGTWRPEGGSDTSSAAIYRLAVGHDGSILVSGSYGGVVDFASGPGVDLHDATAEGGYFVLRMRPDFSLIGFASRPRRLESILPIDGGGLLTYEYRGQIGHGQSADPYLLKLDQNLSLTGSTRVGSAETTLGALTVAGDWFAVIASHVVPNKWDTFLTRYRF